MASKSKMTKEEATSFNSVSPMNAALALDGKTCDCQPYIDIFTFARWKAQGMTVKKGEHGTHINTFVNKTKVMDDGSVKVTGSYPKTTVVFCRCQVKEMQESKETVIIDDGEFLDF